MSLPSLEFNHERWSRLLLRFFWIVIALSLAVELLYMFFDTELSRKAFAAAYILKPSLSMTGTVLLAEAGIRFFPKRQDYILISTSALLAFILSFVHSSVDYLLFFLFFPIMISIFYFQYKKLLYAMANTFAVFYTLYAVNPDIHGRITPVGLTAISLLLAVYSGIAFGVLTRGRETLQHLRSSYESNQELLVRTILMDKLAKTDTLTDTYNHMAYHEFVENIVEQAENGRLTLHIAVIDIDNFKSVNDTYGHRAGDAVLREVSSIAKAKVGPHDFVARYGGEEFVILFTEKEFDEAYATVERIRKEVASTPHESIKGLVVTISVGLNRYIPGMGKERLFQGADAALYEAKRSGKNRTVVSEMLERRAVQDKNHA